MVDPISTGLAVAGSLVKGVAGYQAGKFNRKAARIEAIEAERDGVAEEARVRDAARLAIGQQIAAQGSNGLLMGSGSALEALAQSQVNATLDALTVRRAAAAKARGSRVSGEIAYASGRNALVGGLLGSAATAATDWASHKAAS